MRIVFTGIVFLALMAASSATAAERPKRIERIQNWSVFKHIVDGEPLCWVATTAVATSSNLPKKSVYAFYTLGRYQLSVTSDLSDFPSPTGQLKVGRINSPMFFRAKTGWMKPRDESPVIEAMLVNKSAEVSTGTSRFVFSLRGFEDAAERAAEHCDLPPFT